MTAAAPREYSHSLERRLAAFLLAVILLFSPSGILAHRDAYRAGLIATALPMPLVAAYAFTVAGTEHGNIAAGGDITVTGTLHNIASQVVAQGAITAGNLLNESQHLRIVWEEYRDHKSASDTLTPPLYLDPPFNTILNPAANTFFKTPLLGLIAANSITGGTFVNEGVIQGNTVTLGAGVNGLTNPAIATVIPQNTGNAGQGAASGAAGASQANGTPTGNTVTLLGQTIHLAGATVTGTTGGGQGGQGAGPLSGSGATFNGTTRTAGTANNAGSQSVSVNASTGALSVNVGNAAPGTPSVAVGTHTLAGPTVLATGATGQNVSVNATPASSSVNVGPSAIATPAVTVTQGIVNGPTVTTTGAAGVTVTASVTAGVTVDTPTTSFTGPDVAVNNVNLLAPNATAPPGGGVAGPNVGTQTVTLTGTTVPLTAVNVPGGGGNNPDSDGILLPDSPPIITPTDRPGTAATAGGSEPITNRTNLLDFSVPAGTIIAGTLNLTGDTRNTGFIHADTLNIADTVGRLINERRLANPGQHQYELGNGDYVTERGDRLQPGGFISATNWNVNAQSILNLSGTFEVKGLTPEDTAALTAAFKDQLRQLYGANFTDQEVIEHLIRDVHTNKAPNQFRQILAIAIAIAITVMTSGADGGYALTTLLGNQSAIVAAVGGAGSAGAFALNAAFTALLTGASTQLITTGRIDGRALFQNIAIAAVTAGLTHGFTSEFGHVPVPGGEALTLGQRFTNYAISAGVTGVVQEVAGTGDFRNAFLNSFVSSIAADTARWIGGNIPRTNTFDAAGNVVEANPIGNLVAHAVLGCAAAAAQRTDCASGAIGGATSSLLAGQIDKLFDGTSTITHNALTAGTATLVSGLVASALGRDGVVGANAGANEVLNNFLSDPSRVNDERFRRKLGEVAACIDDFSCRRVIAHLDGHIGTLSNDKIEQICKGETTCMAQRQQERALYQEARDTAAGRMSEGAARLAIMDRMGSSSGFTRNEISDAVLRAQQGQIGSSPVDLAVRAEMLKDPALFAAVLGLSLLDSDGGGNGRSSTAGRGGNQSQFVAREVPQGSVYEGSVFRYENPNRVQTTWDAHPGNVAADHRYSGPGYGATYGGTSSETALAEVAHYGAATGRVEVSRQIRVENVLDLTSPQVRQQLGVTLDQITGNSYVLTQQIGNWARQNGYGGILAPSARHNGGSNLVVFPPKGK